MQFQVCCRGRRRCSCKRASLGRGLRVRAACYRADRCNEVEARGPRLGGTSYTSAGARAGWLISEQRLHRVPSPHLTCSRGTSIIPHFGGPAHQPSMVSQYGVQGHSATCWGYLYHPPTAYIESETRYPDHFPQYSHRPHHPCAFPEWHCIPLCTKSWWEFSLPLAPFFSAMTW